MSVRDNFKRGDREDVPPPSYGMKGGSMTSLDRASYSESRFKMVKPEDPSKAHFSLRQDMIHYVTSLSSRLGELPFHS